MLMTIVEQRARGGSVDGELLRHNRRSDSARAAFMRRELRKTGSPGGWDRQGIWALQSDDPGIHLAKGDRCFEVRLAKLLNTQAQWHMLHKGLIEDWPFDDPNIAAVVYDVQSHMQCEAPKLSQFQGYIMEGWTRWRTVMCGNEVRQKFALAVGMVVREGLLQGLGRLDTKGDVFLDDPQPFLEGVGSHFARPPEPGFSKHLIRWCRADCAELFSGLLKALGKEVDRQLRLVGVLFGYVHRRAFVDDLRLFPGERWSYANSRTFGKGLKNQRLVVLDMDDTIFPSSEWGHMSDDGMLRLLPDMQELDELSFAIHDLFSSLRGKSHVLILSNCDTLWMEATNNYLHGALGQVPCFTTREFKLRFDEVLCALERPARNMWVKRAALEAIVRDRYSEAAPLMIVSVGDQPTDLEAAEALSGGNITIRTVKMKEQPSAADVIRQLRLLKTQLQIIFECERF